MYSSKDAIEDMLLEYPLSDYTLLSHGYVPNSSNYRIRLETETGIISFLFQQCIEVHSRELSREQIVDEEVDFQHEEEPETEDVEAPDDEISPVEEQAGVSPETDSPEDQSKELQDVPDAEDVEAIDEAIDDVVDVEAEQDLEEPEEPSQGEAESRNRFEHQADWVHPNVEFEPFWEIAEFSDRAHEWSLRLPLDMYEVIIQTEWFRLRLIFQQLEIKNEPGKNRKKYKQLDIPQTV